LKALLGGIELGGTKCVCILGTDADDVREQETVPTGAPDVTISAINSVFDRWSAKHGALAAVGLASFGPIDLRRGSATFGRILSTVKPGWLGTDIVGRLGTPRGVPVGVNTDVSGAALAEARWGSARGLQDLAYVTVGTGVGVGLVVGGRPVFGYNHPELGHIRIARRAGDSFPGTCPFHGDCVEGLASGPAIAARAGIPVSQISRESEIWELVAHPLAQLIHTIMLATAPRRIAIGGGVIEGRPELLARLREMLVESINGYLDLEDVTGGINLYVVAPGLGAQAGPLGALAVAADAYVNAARHRPLPAGKIN
jgi:fructokinase